MGSGKRIRLVADNKVYRTPGVMLGIQPIIAGTQEERVPVSTS